MSIKKLKVCDQKYNEVLKQIRALKKFGIKPGLSRVKALLKFLGNPEKKTKFVHISGTNAKSSIAIMAASTLSQAGYKTGLMISPFVYDFCNTMSINKKNITKKEIINLWEKIKVFLEFKKKYSDQITEFELITCMAFEWFSQKKCNIVVLETGLGGRLDATNVINAPLISVITSISRDHEDILGNTLEKIASEKCGIIKPLGTTIIYPEQKKEVFLEIIKASEKNKNKLILPKLSEFKIIKTYFKKKPFGTNFEFKNKTFFLPMVGEHQIKNISVVFKILEELNKKGFKITYKNIKDSIKKTKIPARIEIIKEAPTIILDGAHNPSSVEVLANFIEKNLKNKKIFALFCMLKTKDCKASLKKIAHLIDGFVVTELKKNLIHTSYNSEELSEFIIKAGSKVVAEEKNSKKALKKAVKICTKKDVLLIFGSFYLINYLKKDIQQLGIYQLPCALIPKNL